MEERLAENAFAMGQLLRRELQAIQTPIVTEVRRRAAAHCPDAHALCVVALESPAYASFKTVGCAPHGAAAAARAAGHPVAHCH